MCYRIVGLSECPLQPQHTSGRYWPGYSTGLLPLLAPPIAGLPPLNPVSINTPFHNSKVRLFWALCIDSLVISYTVCIIGCQAYPDKVDWLITCIIYRTVYVCEMRVRITTLTLFLLISGSVAKQSESLMNQRIPRQACDINHVNYMATGHPYTTVAYEYEMQHIFSHIGSYSLARQDGVEIGNGLSHAEN